MYYSDQVVEEIRVGNDIVDIISSYIDLKQKGGSYFGLCPFHNESTPSFSVSVEKQLFHCFGCGASGNVYSFIMQMENYDFPETIKYLADKIHYTLPEEGNYVKAKQILDSKNILYNINKITARFFYNNLLSDEGNVAKSYLELRNINNKTSIKFGLGYSAKKWDKLYTYLKNEGFSTDDIVRSGLIVKDKNGGYFDRFRERLMFPIFDVSGKIIGFGGRTLSNSEPKYLNSPETITFDKSKNLYSINYARQTRQKEVILVEGYLDVISLYQSGFRNVVAILGTALNIEHTKLLYKYFNSVTIVFDSDEAGINATLRSIPILLDSGLKVKVLLLKDAKDPDEYIKKFGKEAFAQELSSAKNHINFQIENLSKKFNLQKTEDKIEFTSQVAKLLSNSKSDIELDVYISYVSKITGISQGAIKSEISKYTDNSLKLVDTKRPFNKSKEKIVDRGLLEAKQNIIYIVSNSYNIYEKVKNFLKPYEMGEPIYVKALETIYNLHSTNNNIYPAEVVNYFNTVEEQKIVSNIFTTYLDLTDIKYINQAVNDQVKIIKKSYIDEKISKTEDITELQQLINTRRNIENLNISVLDG